VDADAPRIAAAIPSARALEDEVARARARHRDRLAALARIAEDAGAPAPGTPQTPFDRLKALLGRILGGPTRSPLPSSLEDEVEAAQRRVSQVAHALDHLAADRAEVRREVEALSARITAAEAENERRAARIAELGAQLDAAVERDPADPSITALEAGLAATDGDRRASSRAVQRLAAIQRLHAEHLAAVDGFERGLAALHEAAAEVLDALDDELADLATEERARQLATVVEGDLGRLRDRVARVNRVAGEGAVLLTEHLDRLADEVELLAPADPAALEAERELSVFLRDRTAAEAVARARQQAELRRRRDRGGDGG
jgi:chromosome segregation ATPase